MFNRLVSFVKIVSGDIYLGDDFFASILYCWRSGTIFRVVFTRGDTVSCVETVEFYICLWILRMLY